MGGSSYDYGLIGVTSLLGKEIAGAAFRFANLVPWYFRVLNTFFVIPGLYSICVALLKKNNNRFIAHFFSPGAREDRLKLVGLASDKSYKYIGTQSGTKCIVHNGPAIGWLSYTVRITKKEVSFLRGARQNARNDVSSDLQEGYISGSGTDAFFTRCDGTTGFKNNDPGGAEIQLHPSQAPLQFVAVLLLSYFWQYSAGVFLWRIVTTRDMFGICVTVSNMLAYFLVTMVVTYDRSYTPKATPSKDVPPGNCIVTDNPGARKLWVVNGEEQAIQNLFQKSIQDRSAAKEFKKCCTSTQFEYIEMFVAVFGILTAIATVILTPKMSKEAQLYLGAQLIVGLLQNMTFASQDGDMMLFNIVKNNYNIGSDQQGQENERQVTFTNRVAAVAAAILYTHGRARYSTKFLPDTADYSMFRHALDGAYCLLRDDRPRRREVEEFFFYLRQFEEQQDQPEAFLAVLQAFVLAIRAIEREDPELASLDINDLSKFAKWPGRLMVDIFEGFIECKTNLHRLMGENWRHL